MEAQALWYTAPGTAELRPVMLTGPRAGEGGVLVRALYSGLSRGTERLVASGQVPHGEHDRMRCPHQEGSFPFPVKYGYALVGSVEDGHPELIGRTVFVLHPHQELALVEPSWLNPLPDGLPPRRAVLAANMETALNVLWDAGAAPGDRILVVGGGVLGLLVAGIAARIAGTEVTVSDPQASREPIARALGAGFAIPAAAPGEQDIVIHTSATGAGLATALASAGPEARVVEASWYGAAAPAVPLGEAFHSRRLSLVSSQVGAVPADRRARWTTYRRLAKALELLCDPAFDALITGEIAFADAAAQVPAALAPGAAGLATVLRY